MDADQGVAVAAFVVDGAGRGRAAPVGRSRPRPPPRAPARRGGPPTARRARRSASRYGGSRKTRSYWRAAARCARRGSAGRPRGAPRPRAPSASRLARIARIAGARVVHEDGLRAPRESASMPERARAGEQVEHAGAVDAGAEDREQRLAHPVGGRPRGGARRRLQRPPAAIPRRSPASAREPKADVAERERLAGAAQGDSPADAGWPSGCRRSGVSGASGRRDQWLPPVPTWTSATVGPSPAPTRQATASKAYSVTRAIEPAGVAGGDLVQRRDPHGEAGGGLGDAVRSRPAPSCSPARGTGRAAARGSARRGQLRAIAVAHDGRRGGKAERAQLARSLLQRHVRREAEPVPERPRRRRRVDPQHLDVHARPHDPTQEPAASVGWTSTGAPGTPRQLVQRHGRVRRPDDQMVKPQRHTHNLKGTSPIGWVAA